MGNSTLEVEPTGHMAMQYVEVTKWQVIAGATSEAIAT